MMRRFAIALLAMAALSGLAAQAGGRGGPVRISHGSRENLETFYDNLLMEEIFRRAGYALEVVEVPWARALELARTGEVDGVCNTLMTQERLVEYTQSLFVPASSPMTFSGDLHELRGLTVGVVRGFSCGADFDARVKAGSIKVYECADTAQLGRMLLAGRFPVAIENDIALAYEVKGLAGFWARVRELEPPVTSRSAYLAFSRQGPRKAELLAACDRALASMKADGTWARILAAIRD